MISPIEEIKNRLDITEVIQSYIKLQKAGANFRAICPFHSEKIPSLFVSPARQIWRCFGCSKGGNIFQFVMEIEGVEFGDALRILAQRAGIELKKQDPKLKTERTRLYEICELSTLFFGRQLQESKTGQSARKYLLKRGVSEDSIRKWRLGYAPDSWQGLSDFLTAKGYSREEVVKAGLAIRSTKYEVRRDEDIKQSSDLHTSDFSASYDRFRGRIIFPVFDLNSQVIGFGGRVLEGRSEKAEGRKDIVEAKYMNTPGTILYDKSRVLYGLDKGKVEIRKKDFGILVEGYLDVILSHQAGFENTMATSGTALTSYQLKILRRYSENLLTAFDMDVAGDAATRRGIDLAQARGFNIKVITMEKDSDPADIISENSQKWGKLISDSKSILEFYFDTAFSKFDRSSAEGKKEISKILLPVIKIIPNKIEKYHWVSQLAKNLEVKEEVVSEELQKVSSSKVDEIPAIKEDSSQNRQKTRQEMIEERILTLILKSPPLLKFIDEKKSELFTEKTREILINLKKNPDFNLEGKISQESFDFLNYLFLKKDLEEEEATEKEIQTCLKEINSLQVKTKLDAVSKEIKKAEEEKNSQKVNSLTQKFNQLSKQLGEPQ